MDLRRLIGRLLAVFVIVGLVAAPLVTPVAAMHPAVTGMTDMAAMSDEMTCCPESQKGDSCQECPLVAMCMLTIAQAEPSAASSIQISLRAHRLNFAFVDVIADGLMSVPPDHPPRVST